MIHKQNGRTYRLVYGGKDSLDMCWRCDFSEKNCPNDNDGWLVCLGDNNENRVLRETLWSKIKNWRR